MAPAVAAGARWLTRLGVMGRTRAARTEACEPLSSLPNAVSGHRAEGGFLRILQVDLEVDSFLGPLGSRSISWQVEYPGSRILTEEAETEIHLSQKDLGGHCSTGNGRGASISDLSVSPSEILWAPLRTTAVLRAAPFGGKIGKTI
ncbi:hypothetical protein SKAU_G00007090 [Synaphobranchus kaupii]|uniref:Transmembrane protein TMEM132 cohesin-like domain-containing protein n=1 Tax=Synaphobranchus kaupii TaxID=118154 RepID=A0A9Q1JAU2_SYNKA|nr:hypothetical protein SKAU_G00007090 [Synaphobranchus kaupii]